MGTDQYAIPTEARKIAQAISAEKSCLGWALVGGLMEEHREALDCVIAQLEPEDFYLPLHRKAFHAIVEQYGRQLPVNFLTVSERMPDESFELFAGFEEHAVGPVDYWIDQVQSASARRKVQAMLQESMNQLGYNSGLVEKFQSMTDEALKTLVSRQKSATTLEEVFRQYEVTEQDRTARWIGSTGYRSLDQVIGRILKGRMYVIAGRSSMGKSAFAQNIFLNLLKQDVTAMYFSIEGNTGELQSRLQAIESGVSIHDIIESDLDFEQQEQIAKAKERIGKSRVHLIDDQTQWKTVKAKIASAKIEDPSLAVVFIDYLGLLHDPHYRNRWDEIGFIVSDLYATCEQCKLASFVVVQVGRGTEQRKNHRPALDDLRDSGNVEQTTDIAMLLYRPNYYDKKHDPYQCDISIAKNRNGPTGSLSLRFYGQSLKFTE